MMLPCKDYAVDLDDLPPHFSPFLENCSQRYVEYFGLKNIAVNTKDYASMKVDVAFHAEKEDIAAKNDSKLRSLPGKTFVKDGLEAERIAELFYPCTNFSSPRIRYIFRRGDHGLGFYKDKKSSIRGDRPSESGAQFKRGLQRIAENENEVVLSKKARKLLKKMKHSKV